MRARTKVFIALLLASTLAPAYAARGATTHRFLLSMSGRSTNSGVVLPPGAKPIQGKVNDKVIAETLQGILPDYAAQFLHLDPEGKFYLFFDSRDSWRVASSSTAANATTLRGQTDTQGNFLMAGYYGFMGIDLDLFVVGKVSWEKGQFVPKSVKGTIYFVSDDMGEMMTLKFKTNGKPEVVQL